MSQKTINQYCVKCGHEDAGFAYFGSKAYVETMPRIDETVALVIDNSVADKEVLMLTCNRCGYQWTVEPLGSNI